MEIITSRQNKKAKYYKSLLQKKYRREEGIFPVEGSVVIEEAILKCAPEYVAIRENEDYPSILKYLIKNKIPYDFYREEVFETLTDTKSPQGIIAYFKIFNKTFKETRGKFIYLDGIKDPGNLGTIIRTSDALKLDGVILSNKTCDLFMPKVVRATMASIFRVPIYLDFEQNPLEKLKENFEIVTTSLEESQDIKDFTFKQNTILVIGNEAHGVSENILKIADKNIKIPMKDGVDSLNVAVAAGILIYEMTRWIEY